MEDAGSAGMHVIPTFDGFESAVDRGTSGPLSSAGRKGGRLFGNSAGRSVATSFTSHVRSAVGIASGLLAGVAVKNFISDSIAEGRDSLKVAALTRTEIRALGDDAGITAKHVGSLATALSHKAAIDDEQIQSGLNVLVTYKNVRNETGHGGAIFDRAAKSATNLAAALASQNGGTPNIAGASKTVGKALADPVKGIASLRKAQIFLTQSQQDNIKSMVAQGDTLGAQKVILKALEDRYTGVAASQATAGEKVAVAWGNIEEKLGKAILPLVDDVEHAILTKGMPAFRHWVRDFEDRGIPAIENFSDTVRDKGLPMLKELVKKGRPLADEILPAMGTALGVTADALAKAAPYATDMVDAFNNAPDWVKKGTVFAGLAALAGKKFGLFDGAGRKAVGGLLSSAAGSSPAHPLYVIQVGGSGLGGAGALEGEGGVIAGGRGSKGRAAGRGSRVRGRVKGGVKAAAAFAAIDALTHFIGGDDIGDENQSALNNTLTGASLGSFAGPYGTVAGAGFGALYGAYNSTPNKDLPVSKYEHSLAGKENWAAQMDGTAGAAINPWQAGIDALNKDIDAAARCKIQPTFDILGVVEADAKVARLRERAERPLEVPLVAKLDRTLTNFFGDVFGGGGGADTPASGKSMRGPAGRFGGVTVHGGLNIQAHDYKDFQRQVQQRMQQQGIGAIGAMQ